MIKIFFLSLFNLPCNFNFFFFSIGFSNSSYILIESFVISTNSLFSINNTFLVYFKIAGMSDAIKFSFSPIPIISGLSFLTAIILSGSSFAITLIAYDPVIFEQLYRVYSINFHSIDDLLSVL